MRTSAGVTYLHGDNLGSTSVASNASGAMLSRQTYYAFGAMRTSDVAPITSITEYNFTGQPFDASDGLMYYNARYYDATLNRFIQPDSIIPDFYNPQYLNRYSYVKNNPVRYTDPTGHRVCEDDDSDCNNGSGTPGTWTPPPPPANTGGNQNTNGSNNNNSTPPTSSNAGTNIGCQIASANPLPTGGCTAKNDPPPLDDGTKRSIKDLLSWTHLVADGIGTGVGGAACAPGVIAIAACGVVGLAITDIGWRWYERNILIPMIPDADFQRELQDNLP